MASFQHAITNLTVGSHTISVIAYNSTGRSYDSDASSTTATTSVLDAPVLTWAQSTSAPDSGTVSWDSIKYATSYNLYLDDVSQGSTTETSWEIKNISLGSHTASVQAVYSGNADYDSSVSKVSFTTTRLATPSITSADSTYVAYDALGQRIVYTFINSDGTTTTTDPQCVVLSWQSISKASQYVVYDNTTTQAGTASSTETSRLLIQSGTTSNNSADIKVEPGNHSYTLVAAYINSANPNASDYNSLPSNAITKSVETLAAPSISWNPDESAMMSIAASSSGIEDFYNVRFFSSGSSTVLNTSNNTRSVAKDSSGVTAFNIYNMASSIGVLQTTASGSSDSYTVVAYAFSYNDFYYRYGSVASNTLTYTVNQLSAPSSLSYVVSVGKTVLNWTGDTNARAYRIDVYTGSSTNPTLSSSITTSDNSTTYTMSLAAGFWIIYVTSLGSTETNINPIYINSSASSPLVVGTLNTPVITRSGQYLSWPAVDLANTYVLYNGTTSNKITEIPATTASSMSYNLSYLAYSLAGIEYNLFVIATATIDSVNYYSGASNVVTFTRKKLAAPTIQFDPNGSSIVKWAAIDSANYYDVYSNSALVTTLASNVLTYTFDYSSANNYSINLVARNSDTFLFVTSSNSNVLSYVVSKLEMPTITYDKASSSINWSAIPNADHYRIYLNKSLVATSSSTSYSFSDLTAGNYGTYIIAVNTSQYVSTAYPNPKYIDSDQSNSVQFGKLNTPVLTLTDNVIIWPAIDNCDNYLIYDNDNLIQSIPGTTGVSTYRFFLNSSIPAVYSIYIIASSDSAYTESSEKSNVIVYAVTQLGSPTISFNASTFVLSWNSIVNADYYNIFVGGILRATTSITSMNIYDYMPKGSTSEIYITASSNKTNYLDSAPSNIISKSVQSDSVATIIIDSVSYAVDCPFTIRETIDETLDTAAVTTVPIDVKSPFEAYTNAEIVISNDSGQPIVIQAPERPYKYLIDSDDVEEIQIGSSAKYKHHLSLIEPTKKLETEILPSFSLTQSLSVVASDYARLSKSYIAPYLNGNVPYSDSQYWLYPPEYYSSDAPYRQYHMLYRWIKGTFSQISDLKGSVPSWSLPGESFNLPNDPRLNLYYEKVQTAFGEKWHNYFTGDYPGKYSNSFLGIYINPSYYGPIHRKWYLRKNNKNSSETQAEYMARRYSETISGNPEYTLIADVTDNSTPAFVVPSLSSGSSSDVYDIVFVIDGTGLNITSNYSFSGMLSSDIPGFYTRKAGRPYTKAYLETLWTYLKPYRVEYDGFQVLQDSTTLKKGSISVSDALDKILTVANNEYYDSKGTLASPSHNTADDPIYTIDDDLTEEILNSYCPEMTFEKGKSLWDVLLEIGRLFGGIPRLITGKSNGVVKNNVISFDILSKFTVSANRFSDYIDNDEKVSSDSQITNHTTGYVSQISNMIPKESFEVYPSSESWILPRSSSDSDAYVTRSNMALYLDKPIFVLLDVRITNFLESNPSAETSLINFIYEDTAFQSLNNDANGKGSALSWKKGTQYIEGLGMIPEAGKTQSMWGLSQSIYVIQNILNKIGYGKATKDSSGDITSISGLKDVNQYKYRVWYIPYTNARVVTEQQNISGLKVPTYMNLNQESNTISDDSFGKSAQTQVSRLGNNSITKTIRLYSYESMPTVGSILVVNNEKYYIDNIAKTFNNNYYDVTAEFSKNWNKINDRVGINSDYRQYEIYASNWVSRDLSLNNYCYVSTSNYSTALSRDTDKIVKDIKVALNGSPSFQAQLFYVTSLAIDSSNNIVRTKYTHINVNDDGSTSTSTVSVPGLLVNAAYNTFRNSIMYSGSMKDNYSAGTYAYSIYNEKYIQQDARYVDDLGKCDIMRVSLCSPSEKLVRYSSSINFGSTYPLAAYYSDIGVYPESNAIFSNKYLINKDNREAMRFVYQMHFITFDRHITIHSGMTKYLYKQPTTGISIGTDSLTTGGNVLIVGYRNYLNESEVLNPSQDDVFGNAAFSFDNDSAPTSVHTSGMSVSVGNANYSGFAFIWSNTHEILFNYDFDTPKPITSIPEFYLNFSSDKLKYRTI